MLTPGIHAAYTKGTESLASHDKVETGRAGQGGRGHHRRSRRLLPDHGEAFLADEALAGP